MKIFRSTSLPIILISISSIAQLAQGPNKILVFPRYVVETRLGSLSCVILEIVEDKRVEPVSNQSFLLLPPRNVTAVYDYVRHG